MKKLFICAVLIALTICNQVLSSNNHPNKKIILNQKEQALQDHIKKVLDSHLLIGQKWGMKFHTYRPGLEKYSADQWLWDSCFHMIVWSRINVTNSILDLRTMLQRQLRTNGRIPEMIYWGKQSTPEIIMNKLLYSETSQNDLTQMPMIPVALKRIYQASNKSKEVLQQFLVKLIEFHSWWAYQRQPDHDGLIVIIHPWQSGIDASPMYDQALKVGVDQPNISDLYYQFIELLLSYKYVYQWDQEKIVKKKIRPSYNFFLEYFIVKQVGVNAIYTYGWKILADLSKELGNKQMTEYCTKQYYHFLNGLISLYDQQKGRYVSHYLDGNEYKPTKKNTVQGLFPLIVPDIPQSHKDSILAMLKSEKHYKSDFPIPTVSRSDQAYNPVFTSDLMWRGPTWAPPNYFILQALRNEKQYELFKQIGQKWVNHTLKNGIWQMWNPQTGEGYGVQQLGMSTCVIDTMYQLKELQM